MSKNLILIALLLVLLTGCAPGSDVEVNVPSSTVVLTTPGPNPEQDKAAPDGQVAGIVQGLWHGLIAPVTLVGSFLTQTGRCMKYTIMEKNTTWATFSVSRWCS